jgi:predicted amidohydrolase
MRVAIVQLTAGDDKAANLDQARRLLARAATGQPDLVALPENFNCLGASAVLRAEAEDLDGPTVRMLRAAAREHGYYLVGGSFKRRIAGGERLGNTTVLVDPQGEIQAIYDKVHQFDADIAGVRYRASEIEQPGQEIVVSDVRGVPVGLALCYDLRFPEMFRVMTLRGARVVCVPSAFTYDTGRDHWEVLLRARAIENQVYVVAPAQFGCHPAGLRTHGRSLVVDPWGTVLVQAPDETTVLFAEIDLARQDAIRQALPALQHRRPAVYGWPDPVDTAPPAGLPVTPRA